MFKRTKISAGVLVALGGVLLVPVAVQAQDTQRIEITGSAIKRIAAEGALPVQVIRKDEIERSGATTVTDLLQRLPAMQGGFGESGGVGGTGGFNGASIHNIGDTRTLVLLNGHRLAQWGGQLLSGFGAGIDLNSLPVSAIERVEILTDGASALYGSDAIAGVVNFITRRDRDDGDISIGYSAPKGGARETRISATKGIGTLAKDGFNAILTLSHDERTKLDATQRSFGNTGKVFFSNDGKNYRFQQFSARAIPANVADDLGQQISPYRVVNGVCPDKTFRVIEPYNDGSGLVDDYCGFDFVGELEIYPIRERDAALLSLNKRLGEHELFADFLYSKSKQISRIAPVPGAIAIAAGSPLHNQYLLPIGITQDTTANYRLYDLGKRENQDVAKFYDLAIGSKGSFAGWDYSATLTQSESDAKTSLSGYPGALAVRRLTRSGALDPFVGPGQQSAAGLAAIAAANYKGYWDGGVSELTTAQLRGSRDLMKLEGGSMALATGLNFNKEKFQSKPSLFAQGKLADPVAGTLCDPTSADPLINQCDQRFGDEAATVAYSADRKSYGLFGELAMPLTKALEVTASLRYDHYSDFGKATTGKASFRFQPTRELLVRGSVGTGFHAPTVPQVNAVQQPFGVTNDNYTCTPELLAIATSLGAVCQPGNTQYDKIAGGNKDLQPEKSKQATLGLRFEPTPAFSAGVDLWWVGLRDAFGQQPEAEVFGNPTAYPNAWGTKTDTGTGTVFLAWKNLNENLGKYYATGLDFDIVGRTRTGWGDLTSQLAWTYMIRESQQLQKNGPYYSAIGNFAEVDTVTFRWQGKWTNTLKMGNWTHTLAINGKSGYLDAATDAELLDAGGNVVGIETLRLKVKEYFTADWQTVWAMNKNLQFTVGVLNIADTKPPFAISTGGNNRGQQFGYDDRYYDPRGRTWYVNGSLRF